MWSGAIEEPLRQWAAFIMSERKRSTDGGDYPFEGLIVTHSTAVRTARFFSAYWP